MNAETTVTQARRANGLGGRRSDFGPRIPCQTYCSNGASNETRSRGFQRDKLKKCMMIQCRHATFSRSTVVKAPGKLQVSSPLEERFRAGLLAAAVQLVRRPRAHVWQSRPPGSRQRQRSTSRGA